MFVNDDPPKFKEGKQCLTYFKKRDNILDPEKRPKNSPVLVLAEATVNICTYICTYV